MIKWAIPHHLARSPRPGNKHLPAQKKEVLAWMEEARALGMRSIICLLSKEELHDYYQHVGIDLLQCYQKAGLEVAHHPLSEYGTPPISSETLVRIGSDYQRLPKPCLVHCNAGIERTGKVIDYLLRLGRYALP